MLSKAASGSRQPPESSAVYLDHTDQQAVPVLAIFRSALHRFVALQMNFLLGHAAWLGRSYGS